MKSLEPQQSWPEFNPVSSSIWDIPSNDSLHSWPSSSSSPTAPTAVRPSTCFSCPSYHKCSLTSFFFNFSQSLLGNSRNPWSATAPFGSSIWSTGADSTLNPFPPTTSSTTLTDFVTSPAPSPPATTEMTRTYNPWSAWRPTLSRRNAEPWPSSSDNGN